MCLRLLFYYFISIYVCNLKTKRFICPYNLMLYGLKLNFKEISYVYRRRLGCETKTYLVPYISLFFIFFIIYFSLYPFSFFLFLVSPPFSHLLCKILRLWTKSRCLIQQLWSQDYNYTRNTHTHTLFPLRSLT